MLYTIGHSSHPIERFIELLRRHRIEVLADVRSVPASGRHPQFRKAALQRSLAEAGIRYVFLGRELGARREEPEARAGDKVSYEKTARLPAFRQGLRWLREHEPGHRLAIMCAEREPLDCHRTLLVCRHLRDDLEIGHILADGRLEPHAETERRLLAATGLEARQEDLFGEPSGSSLDRAYRLRDPATTS